VIPRSGYNLSDRYFNTEQDYRRVAKVGFLVNPIAGMGGRVGLKGTDGKAEEARKLGAVPVAGEHAAAMLAELKRIMADDMGSIEWLTCSGDMGADLLEEQGLAFAVLHEAGSRTGAADTLATARKFVEAGADIVVFAGGDGTARDVCSVLKRKIPMLGIPSGVKMHSGVFGVTPAKTAEVLAGFVRGGLKPADVEIMDLDEDLYRKGEWVVRLYDSALTPFEPTLVQTSKEMVTEASDADIIAEIAEFVDELARDEPETLFILGPGGTTEAIGRRLGMDKTLLGVDAFAGGSQAGKDLNEDRLLKLLNKYNKIRLILSPVGSQGFVLGRGNLQLSPTVVRRVRRDDIMIVSTPAKLAKTPVLRFDTGDAELDRALAGKGWFPVVFTYRTSRLVKVAI
jgi:predicted polyphosphate/ATP-dependent NAD kinase